MPAQNKKSADRRIRGQSDHANGSAAPLLPCSTRRENGERSAGGKSKGEADRTGHGVGLLSTLHSPPSGRTHLPTPTGHFRTFSDISYPKDGSKTQPADTSAEQPADAEEPLTKEQDAAMAARRQRDPGATTPRGIIGMVEPDDAEPFDPDNTLGLTDAQLRAIEFTVSGLGDMRIADMLKITPKTLWRWKALNENYRLALDEARRRTHGIAVDRVQRLLLKATGVLDRHMDDASMDKQFRAAHILLTMAGSFKPPAPPPLRRDDEDDDYDYRPEPRLPPKVG